METITVQHNSKFNFDISGKKNQIFRLPCCRFPRLKINKKAVKLMLYFIQLTSYVPALIVLTDSTDEAS